MIRCRIWQITAPRYSLERRGLRQFWLWDKLPKSMFWNRFCAGSHAVDWQNALREEGRSRFAFLKALTHLHREEQAICDGDFAWYDCGNDTDILSYVRSTADEKVTVFINIGKDHRSVKLPAENGKALLLRNAEVKAGEVVLHAYGVAIIRS